MQESVRKVDAALHPVLNGSDIPLILAADDPLASMFRSATSYPNMATDIIEGNPRLTTDAQITDLALPILDHIYANNIERAKALYDARQVHELGDYPPEVQEIAARYPEMQPH